MLTLAISLSAELEKIGAYAGIVAFFGFAVLIVLYFAQSREVKRLREWAGRAPERALELEHRVVAAADQRRVRAEPIAKPATVAATPAGAAAAAKPAAPGTEAKPAEAGTAAVAAEAAKPGEAAAEATGAAIVAAAAPAASAPGTAPPAAPAPGTAAPGTAAPGTPSSAPPPVSRETGAGDGTPPAAPAESAAPATPAPASGEPAPETGEQEAAASNGTSGEIPVVPPVIPPRATPAPRPTPPPLPPRRAVPAAPLRSTRPTATPRRAGAVHASRHEPVALEPEGRSRRTLALASGGVVAGLLVAVLVVTQLIGGDAKEQTPPNVPRNATPTPTPAEEDTTTAGTGSKASRAETTVAVLNGTTSPGLAAVISDRLVAAGFAKGAIENFSDSQRSASLIFYAPDARTQAREVSKILKISDLQPMNEDVQALSSGADVVVVVGADQTP